MTDIQDINSTNRQHTQETLSKQETDALSQQETDTLEDWTMLDSSDMQSEQDEYEILSCCSDDRDSMHDSSVENQNEDNPLENKVYSAQLVDEITTVEVASYIRQCRNMLADTKQCYDDIRRIGEQYPVDLLSQLIKFKIKEWYTLQQIVKEKSYITSVDGIDIITKSLPGYIPTTSLELYAHQCSCLLEQPQQYYESVRIVGQNCILGTLQQLMVHKDNEWTILCEIQAEHVQRIDSMHFTIKRIASLVVSTPQYTDDIMKNICNYMNQRNEEFVFGAGTAAATRIFLEKITVARLNEFANCMIQIIRMTRVAIEERKPTQDVKDKVQAIIEKGRKEDNRTDIFDMSAKITFQNIGDMINKYSTDMLFNRYRRSEYRDLMLSLKTTTLLLIIEYMYGMQEEVMVMLISKM